MSKLNLTTQMKELLGDYSDEVMHEVIRALEDVAEDTADTLHTAGDFKDRTGKYRKGWTTTKEEHRTYSKVAVHNKKHYMLTHLLEFGHSGRDGSRKGAAEPFVHIAPVNEKAQEDAVRKIKEVIEKIK